jgi:hypothetical protein
MHTYPSTIKKKNIKKPRLPSRSLHSKGVVGREIREDGRKAVFKRMANKEIWL